MHVNISNQQQKPQQLNLKFKHPWRAEQQRVLDNISQYLGDKRIHIVAAPGAGKTVIGIEIFNQLQIKTLVVSPTRLIRNQWVERLQDFLPFKQTPNWCGKNLDKCHYFTTTTYQALFSLDQSLTNETDEVFNNINQWFNTNQFKLLILDEAHHLKAAWQKVLMKFIASSKDLIVVSLTATPPYDASAQEWSHYLQLCGPVDEQISIPELVKSNSLCPHQDYIWMVKTDEKNITSLKHHQLRLSQFIDSLAKHAELQYLLELHYWLDENIALKAKDVLYHLDECFALLGFLKFHQRKIPLKLLSLLGISEDSIEPISISGWEVLLQSFIDGQHYPLAKPIDLFKQTFITLLKNKHLLKRNRVNLDNSQKKLQAFNKTQERIKACLDITKLEYANRKNWMRLVILSDFIRDEKYQLALDGLEASTGAYPIFHYFIHHLENSLQGKTILLTGRLTIIPSKIITELSDSLADDHQLKTEIYSEHPDYVVIKNSHDTLIFALTQLHRVGTISIIIGTRSLLGEGWDAPHVNSIIMATQTGAYVTTNQLRGRAIRIDTTNELKTSSIWHIIAIADQYIYNQFIFQDLHKRFKTFAGLHATELKIESGIDRMALSHDNNSHESVIEQSNTTMGKRLKNDIFNLQARWQNALNIAQNHVMRTGLQINFKQLNNNNLSRYVAKVDSKFKRSLKKIRVITFSSTALTFAALAFFNITSLKFIGISVAINIAIYLFFYKRTTAKALISLHPLHYSKIFTKVVMQSLHVTKNLQNVKPYQDNDILITQTSDNYFRFSLLNYTHKDNQIFLTALSQLLEPIQRPRYLIALYKNAKCQEIFPVPNIFGINKKNASLFLQSWKQHLPEFKNSHLIATSSEIGRTVLLKLSAQQYSQTNKNQIRLIDRWE